MPIYRYKAVTSDGKKIQGQYNANSKNEVISMLKLDNIYPIEINEVIGSKDIKDLEIFNKIKTKDIAVFCRQFYTMLNSGVTIVNCLEVLKNQTENKKLKKTLGQVFESVQKGMTLSESLKEHKDVFPELLINMVEAGEVSGNLDTIMDRMAVHYEKENKINNKIKNAMIYPIILSIVAIIVVVFLLTVVMPTFVSMFQQSGAALPVPTRVLLGISNIIKSYWYLIITLIMILIYLFKKYYATEKGKAYIDKLKLKIPVLNKLIRKITTSRFTRTLSTLLSSGVPLIRALEIVSKVVGNRVVEEGLNVVKDEVRRGLDLASPIEKLELFPPMVVSMIRIGEESGSLDEILDKTANFYDEEVEDSLHRLTSLIEPLMIIIMALIIGFIVISMVLPMFDMINTVRF
ncbi:type II secretion system protein F [Caloranaerobacter azorensis H53214]|uniref:Type IV pilus assembly protein PilC n=2 Tax=Caloranaerobacter azorensis TaxID=116090 RepID=A0A1M5RWB2_9FIRM|nr:type II secretion system F family protein [Caloranaerobacter azorensis]KGG81450.1 type II secretion system protein F [Caloranaerobacter azorensis H53214]SHH30469.1 type IV pilus assembly protein PilC [Caloranaerobacter azorensis DSM 13643]